MIESLLSTIFAILRLEGYDRVIVPKWLILAAVITLLGSITLWRLTVIFVGWWNRPSKSPQRLFRALCDRHQLSQSERSVLQKMAAAGTYDPNYLFIDPDLWKMKSGGSESETHKQALFQKLFGQFPASN